MATTIFFILLLVQSPGSLLAQDAEAEAAQGLSDNLINDIKPIIIDVEGLRLEIAEQTQDPDTKWIVFDVLIHSQIRSDRVQLNWSIDGSAELIGNTRQVSLSVDPGSLKHIQIIVRPRAHGISNLRISAEAFEAEGTYLSSILQKVYSLSDGERLPRTDTYRTMQFMSTVRQITKFLLYIFGGVLVLRSSYGVFKRWLNMREAELDIV